MIAKWKQKILAVLFFLIYLFLFLFWWGWIVSAAFFFLFLIIIFIPWGGNPKFLTIRKMLKKINQNRYQFFIPQKQATIAVALSGGIDSAVSAYLLQKQGYKVKCFFMRNWDSMINGELNISNDEETICEAEEDFKEAKKIADFLGLELIRINFVKEYWDLVFEDFLKKIENGITPNPDILCNKKIKFGKFLEYIENNFPEINYIATGHYAKIKYHNEKSYLFCANDQKKDQTYFLAEIDKENLNKLFFPLGNWKKSEVKQLAKKIKLPNANRKESMGICFIGKRNFPKFINNYLKGTPGKIIDKKTNEIVGKHQGLVFYTIGQRKGLSLSGFELPYYVCGKDLDKNILYVANQNGEEFLQQKTIISHNFNFLVDKDKIKKGKRIIIKTRHSKVTYNGKIRDIYQKKDDYFLIVKSDQPIKYVTPGQELVIYENELCLGGGEIIDNAL